MRSFDELYARLCEVAEQNRAEGFLSFPSPRGNSSTRLNSFALHPDEIELIVKGVSDLRDEIEAFRRRATNGVLRK